MKIFHVSDGSKRPPRLALYGNSWGLSELPQRPSPITWSLDEVLEKLAAAGFDGMQAGPVEAKQVRKANLRFAMSARINSPHELDDIAHEASDCGADALTLHAGWGMESDQEMRDYATAVIEASLTHRLPIYLETHRATMTQDIYRTCQLIEQFPDLRFNGDYSHYYCGHEMTYRGFTTTRNYLMPILQRTAFFHGRIANGETMQIDVGDGQTDANAQNFRWLWETAMTFWLEQAQPGDILPFTPELGPPSSGYSLTFKNSAGEQVENSDRWSQTQVFADLARTCFANAVARARLAGVPAAG